ncbi:MAG: sigma-70 family RNA polymerase sigma factor [Plectolyngbya sp. WJT66-NPBG17]|jgi:DNA-directed RNA polymerase specialized sigma24 family protein|nr:sigma-70 family RNA polymerase sigma factor [Plectolyngbya sp. WJT66-NPBG17]
MNDSEKDCQRRAIEEVMNQILDADSPHAYSMIPTVRRYIYRFNLKSRVEPAEILIEAYLRALRATHEEIKIENPKAWLRSTAYNIVRERSRKEKKEFPTDPQALVLDSACEPGNHCEANCDRNLAILWQAFKQLRAAEPEIAELIDLQILQQMSWSEIQQHFRNQGRKTPTIEALRQRVSRAKKKLRQLFHKLGGEYEPLRF